VIALVVVALASIGLVAWLVVALGGFALEPRVPRRSAIARFARLGVRHGRSAREAGRAEQAAEESPDEPPDVEMAVRQRLYGSRARRR
jgi:hypothetical protein